MMVNILSPDSSHGASIPQHYFHELIDWTISQVRLSWVTIPDTDYAFYSWHWHCKRPRWDCTCIFDVVNRIFFLLRGVPSTLRFDPPAPTTTSLDRLNDAPSAFQEYPRRLWDRGSPNIFIDFHSGWCHYRYTRLHCKSAITTWRLSEGHASIVWRISVSVVWRISVSVVWRTSVSVVWRISVSAVRNVEVL